MPKYCLLLNDFIKHMDNDHPLKPIYQQAYDKFKEVCDENN